MTAAVTLWSAQLCAQEAIKNVGQLRPVLPDFIKKQTGPFTLPEIKEPSLQEQQQSTFVLREVQFSGNTVFSDRELKALFPELLGSAVSLDKLEYIRTKITQHYIASGYINSGAILPSQNVQQGTVRYNIVEGRLNHIIIQGDEGLPEHFIKERLHPKQDTPFNLIHFQEKYQLLLNDPLFEKFDGEFKPGTAPGGKHFKFASKAQ